MEDLAREGFRLSPQQKYLWALDPTPAQSYRVTCVLTIEDSRTSEALKHSLADVVRRHEIFRTTFERAPGMKTPLQVVTEQPRFSWEEVDLSDLDLEQRQTEVDRFFEAARMQSFNLEQGPLLRASCLKLTDNRHALVLTVPALCADQRTLWNLVNEISQSPQPDSQQPIQYADFAEWQNRLLEAEDKVAVEANTYWQQQETLLNQTSILPLEKRPAASRTFEPDSVRFQLKTDLVEKIESTARKYQTSVSVVLLACWQVLLWRLSGQTDRVVWCLHEARKIEDLKTAMGPFAKYLPVSYPGGDGAFSDYVKQAKVAVAQTEEWQEYFNPLARPDDVLHEEANIVAFEFQEEPKKHSAGSVSITRRAVCINPFKIKLGFLSAEGSLQAEVEYNSQVLNRDAVERIATYFQQLLFRVVQDPEVQVGAVDILNADEQRELLFGINQTAADFPHSLCVHELFEQQVTKTPDSPALVYEDQVLTYTDLNRRANQVAHILQKHGAGPGSQVALCMKRSAETVVGLLGILKAGAAYVPLNPDHPTTRLQIQLDQSHAIICLANSSDIGPFENSEVIVLDRDWKHLTHEATTNSRTPATPLNLVYVIFTSGSTGVPKGVAVRHESLVNYSSFILNKLASDAPLNFASVSTISADLGNTCIFPSLISGGCLHLINDDTAMDGRLLAKYVSDHSIDVLKIVPSHLNALLESPAENFLPAKHLFLGGEALSWDLIKRLSQLKYTCKLTNHYGPTETTIGSLTYDIDENDISPDSLTVPIGRPIANTRVYLLDQHRKLVPRGVAGELFIGGIGVADGYRNQPVETAARFVPDPFSSNPDARLYKTGDIVKQLADGAIEFIGRADHQVKIRGYRVELAEVEAALEEHPDVRQAVVVVRAEADREQLVAYVTVNRVKSPSHDDIRGTLTQKLPNYMIPSAFVVLESFPLTANGKLNRAALPAPDEARPKLQRVFVAPRTESEEEIAEIWSSVLKLNKVGIHDDFFELGGHSLLATQVVARVRKAFQVELPLRSIFDSPTVAEFAGRIEQAKDAELAKLLNALETLSDEEAQKLLATENERHKDAQKAQ